MDEEILELQPDLQFAALLEKLKPSEPFTQGRE